MSLSTVARAIAESATLRLNAEAQRLRDRGEAVINLGIGEPKNKAPGAAIQSASAKLNTGDIKYAPADGLPSLKRAIIRYTEENYGRSVSPGNVIVSSGAKQSLFNLLYTLIDPKDQVIIVAPYWVSYPEMVRMCYGVPVIVTPRDESFQPSLEDIAAAVTSSTRAIIVNSPNNPAGVVYKPEFISEIVAFCEGKGIYLIMDDIYHKLVFDGIKAPSAFQYTQQDMESTHVVIINGVSKLYGMTGFRIGWTIAPKELVGIMSNVQGQTTTCASPLLQVAAEGALNGPQDVVEDLRQTIERNRNAVLGELGSIAGVTCTQPEGTFYCFPNLCAYSKDSVALSNLLLTRALVVTVPGKEFGMEGHLRLSYAGSSKDVTEGLARIKWALDPNSPTEINIGDKRVVRDWVQP